MSVGKYRGLKILRFVIQWKRLQGEIGPSQYERGQGRAELDERRVRRLDLTVGRKIWQGSD